MNRGTQTVRPGTEGVFPAGNGYPAAAGRPDALATRRVLRNTYALLSMTLLFSALIAAASVAMKLPAPGIVVTLVGYFGLLFAVHKLRNSVWALPTVFPWPASWATPSDPC